MSCGCEQIKTKTIPAEIRAVAKNLANKEQKPFAITFCSDYDFSLVKTAVFEQILEIITPD